MEMEAGNPHSRRRIETRILTRQDQQWAPAAIEAIENWLRHRVQASPLPAPWPGLETLEPARPRTGRHGAILLPFRALLAAIEDAS